MRKCFEVGLPLYTPEIWKAPNINVIAGDKSSCTSSYDERTDQGTPKSYEILWLKAEDVLNRSWKTQQHQSEIYKRMESGMRCSWVQVCPSTVGFPSHRGGYVFWKGQKYLIGSGSVFSLCKRTSLSIQQELAVWTSKRRWNSIYIMSPLGIDNKRYIDVTKCQTNDPNPKADQMPNATQTAQMDSKTP